MVNIQQVHIYKYIGEYTYMDPMIYNQTVSGLCKLVYKPFPKHQATCFRDPKKTGPDCGNKESGWGSKNQAGETKNQFSPTISPRQWRIPISGIRVGWTTHEKDPRSVSKSQVSHRHTPNHNKTKKSSKLSGPTRLVQPLEFESFPASLILLTVKRSESQGLHSLTNQNHGRQKKHRFFLPWLVLRDYGSSSFEMFFETHPRKAQSSTLFCAIGDYRFAVELAKCTLLDWKQDQSQRHFLEFLWLWASPVEAIWFATLQNCGSRFRSGNYHLWGVVVPFF